jgi:hypothetical protein
MADKKKLTDNQISALSLFYGGASVLTQNALDKGDKLTLEEAIQAIRTIHVGATLTGLQMSADLSFNEVYMDEKNDGRNDAPSLDMPPIHDTFEADVVDLNEYKAKGGLLN